MIIKLILTVFVGHVLLSSVVDATNHTEILEKAVENLVDYAADESGNTLDSLDIKKSVIGIAQQQFDARIGEYVRNIYLRM